MSSRSALPAVPALAVRTPSAQARRRDTSIPDTSIRVTNQLAVTNEGPRVR